MPTKRPLTRSVASFLQANQPENTEEANKGDFKTQSFLKQDRRMMMFIQRVPRDTQIGEVIQHLRGRKEINVNDLHITAYSRL